ncbi:MAG TPA: glycosyltransferase family 2 protein [Solirubrobacterales bacterium]
MPGPRVSVVVVTHNSREAIARTLPALAGELDSDDELIVVDNDSADGTPAAIRELVPGARIIETGANPGFAAACNAGAEAAGGDLLVLLNPDALPEPGFRDAIARPLGDGRVWAAWMGLVTEAGGRKVNTRGGVIHFTGIAWAGGAGEPLPEGGIPAAEVPFASGACLAVPLERWRAAGGMPEPFFLYQEDVDLSLRLRLAGGTIGIEPAARVDHDYEFSKGAAKWRYLERNRWAVILRTYPLALLLALAPALVATEVAVFAIALAGGWGRQKVLAKLDLVRWLPRLLRERRAIQATRAIPAAEFARHLTPDLDSAYLGRAARSRGLRAALRAYWSVVLALLGSTGDAASGSRGATG